VRILDAYTWFAVA